MSVFLHYRPAWFSCHLVPVFRNPTDSSSCRVLLKCSHPRTLMLTNEDSFFERAVAVFLNWWSETLSVPVEIKHVPGACTNGWGDAPYSEYRSVVLCPCLSVYEWVTHLGTVVDDWAAISVANWDEWTYIGTRLTITRMTRNWCVW